MAVLVPFMLALTVGVIDFGQAFETRVAVTNASREGARYASLNPTSFSNSNTAKANSIEGHVQLEGGGLVIPNRDANILIQYYTFDGTTETFCGAYSQASGGTPPPAPCTVSGNLVKVTVTVPFSLPVTGFSPVSSIALKEVTTMVIA